MTRLLVIDAYDDAGRESLSAGGCTHAGLLYRDMLARLDPGLEVDIIQASKPTPELPPGASLSDYAGVVWTGSNLSAHRDTPEVRGQAALVRAHLEAGVPGFGSCWAAQIAVVAAGGTVAPNPKGREFGVARKIALTDTGCGHPLYVGKPRVFDGFTSHEDEITHLPRGASLLAGNAFSAVQAVHLHHGGSHGGWFWGLQYHPEYGPGDVARLGIVRGPQLVEQGFFEDANDHAAYVDAWERLHHEPSRADLAFRLGVDQDVLDPTVRTVEVSNWLSAIRSS